MNARSEELLDAFQQHFAAELEGDVEKTLATVTDDIVYEHPFRLGIIQGRDAVRRYYETTWAERPFRSIELRRHWISGDDTIIVETEAMLGRPNGPVHRVRTLCIGVFRGMLLAKEIVYPGTDIPNGLVAR